ncbi:glutamine synthetase family protein [Colwelliaceae bacterium 6441]
MKDLNIRNAEDVLKLLEAREVAHVQIGLTDHTGQLRGKYISKDKLISGLKNGIPMTRNLAAVDFTDVIYPVEGLIVNGGGFGDSVARIVPESCREVPWERPDRNLFFLLEHEGEGVEYDPRAICNGLMKKAESMGLFPVLSCELEFRVFNETVKSLYEKDFKNLEHITPVSNYLGVMRQTVLSDFFADFTDAMEHMGIPIEVAHLELAPGFAELVLAHQKGMRGVDNAVIYKTFAKAFALRKDKLISFMARTDDQTDGSSCHINISLNDENDNPAFYDADKPQKISDTMRYFLGGIQKLLPELMLMMAPNVNSFKRYVPGIFAPIASTWGVDNRTTSLRVNNSSPKAQRIENRVPGADVNPYFAVACTLGAGLWGIENQVEPSAETEGDLGNDLSNLPAELMFPSTFKEAIERFQNSTVAKEIFGEEFVRIYSSAKNEHELEFRKAVTDWELRRYLELS